MDRSTLLTALCVPAVFIFIALRATFRRRRAQRKGPQRHVYPKPRYRSTDLPRGWSWPETSSRIVHASADRPPVPPYSKPPHYEVHKVVNADGWTLLDVDVLYKDEFRIIEILPGQVERIEDGKGETAVVLKDKTTLYLLTWKYAPAEIRLALEGKSWRFSATTA